jgi:hypothetical protein
MESGTKINKLTGRNLCNLQFAEEYWKKSGISTGKYPPGGVTHCRKIRYNICNVILPKKEKAS